LLTHESIRAIFEKICSVKVADDISSSILRTADIREGDDYPGIRVSLSSDYPLLKVPLTVNVTTGDRITPREIEYSFDDRSISILAYNMETIFAEKFETVISRNIASTRPRDLYDIYILHKLRSEDCDPAVLKLALEETSKNAKVLMFCHSMWRIPAPRVVHPYPGERFDARYPKKSLGGVKRARRDLWGAPVREFPIQTLANG
jgi:hypothetical protein